MLRIGVEVLEAPAPEPTASWEPRIRALVHSSTRGPGAGSPAAPSAPASASIRTGSVVPASLERDVEQPAGLDAGFAQRALGDGSGWRRREDWQLQPGPGAAVPSDRNERALLSFVQGLCQDDRQHLLHNLGTTVLHGSAGERADWAGRTSIDERRDADREGFLHDALRRVVRRPLRDAALEVSPAGELRADLATFGRENVPVIPDAERRRRSGSLGRLAGRLRPGQGGDTVEVGWVRRGVRVGSSLERLRVHLGTQLTEDVGCGIQWQRHHDSGRDDVRFDLIWQIESRHRLRLAVAQGVQFPDSFLAGELDDRRREGQRPDSEFGVLFFVEQQF